MNKIVVTILTVIGSMLLVFGYTIHTVAAKADELDYPVEEEPELPYTYVSSASCSSTDNDTEKEIIVKFILENTDQTEEITEKDLQLKSIINGSFSEPCKREALYIVKMLHRPHVAGIDSYIGIIVDLETGQPLRYCEFRSDKTELYVLSSENGLCKVLFVGKQESTGSSSYVIKLFSFEKGIEEINMFISPLMFLNVIINSRGFWSLNIA